MEEKHKRQYICMRTREMNGAVSKIVLCSIEKRVGGVVLMVCGRRVVWCDTFNALLLLLLLLPKIIDVNGGI